MTFQPLSNIGIPPPPPLPPFMEKRKYAENEAKEIFETSAKYAAVQAELKEVIQ